jgi:RNA polymerase sigma factor (sigma-70 family)
VGNRGPANWEVRPTVAGMATTDIHRTVDAVWRIDSARIITGLTRMVRDVGLAEELAQDALVAALERWPESGVPENPGAWLMAAAKRRAIDQFRRRRLLEQKHEVLGRELENQGEDEFDLAEQGEVSDDLLRLIFTAGHPVLSPEARVALTLRLLGGLTTDEIARLQELVSSYAGGFSCLSPDGPILAPGPGLA